LFGLGILYGMEFANRQAAQFFDACVKEVERAYGADKEWLHDRLWYRAKLNAGIARANELTQRATEMTSTVPGASLVGSTNKDLLEQAQERFRAVANGADATILELVGDAPAATHGKYGDLVRFLANARAYATVTYQATVDAP
jgi:hypothetical protein